MSHDEETVVRQRLRRLTEPGPAPGDRPAALADPAPAAAASEFGAGLPLGDLPLFDDGLPLADPVSLGDRPSLGDPLPLDGRLPLVDLPVSAVRRAARPGGAVPAAPRPGVPPLPGPEASGKTGLPADGGEPAPGSRLLGPGAFDPGRRGVRVLAIVAVAVVLAAGGWAWRSRPRPEPVAPLASASGPVDSTDGPAASSAGELVVAVAGKVRRPGLVRLPAGARLADALQAAGGALPGVEVALLNPARKVTDGELIVVGGTPPPAPGGAGPPAGGAPTAAAGPLNLNTATLAQLDTLPGVGPVLAQRILTHRDQHGGFRSVGDLRQVEGIGDARYEQLKDLVTV